MTEHASSKKVAEKIVKALDVLVYSPPIAASILAKAPGPIQHRLWLTIKVLIELWAIDAKNRTYDPQYKEIHEWAEKMEKRNGKDHRG
jgi:hypothetical protein